MQSGGERGWSWPTFTRRQSIVVTICTSKWSACLRLIGSRHVSNGDVARDATRFNYFFCLVSSNLCSRRFDCVQFVRIIFCGHQKRSGLHQTGDKLHIVRPQKYHCWRQRVHLRHGFRQHLKRTS